jgi:hypothetical protein
MHLFMPRKKTTGRTHASKGVSMDPAFAKRITERAESLNMTFSQYVRYCLELDVNKGPITVTPKKR